MSANQEEHDSEAYQKQVELKVFIRECSINQQMFYRTEHKTSFYELVDDVLVDKKTGKEVVAEATIGNYRTQDSSTLDLNLKLSRLKNPLKLFKLKEKVENYLWEKLPEKLWKKIDEKLEKLSNPSYYKDNSSRRRNEVYVFCYEKEGQVYGVELDCRRSVLNIHENCYGNLPETVGEAIKKNFKLNEESREMALFLLKLSKEGWRATSIAHKILGRVNIAFQAAMFQTYREELSNKKVVVCNLPNNTHVRMVNNEAVYGSNYFDYGVSAFEFQIVRAECWLTKLEE
jgi:hypothetical protein